MRKIQLALILGSTFIPLIALLADMGGGGRDYNNRYGGGNAYDNNAYGATRAYDRNYYNQDPYVSPGYGGYGYGAFGNQMVVPSYPNAESQPGMGDDTNALYQSYLRSNDQSDR